MNEPQPAKTPTGFWAALGLAWEFGYLIVIPLLAFSLAGRWGDRVFHTSPWLFLAGLAVSMPITIIFLVKKFSRILHDINNEPTKKP